MYCVCKGTENLWQSRARAHFSAREGTFAMPIVVFLYMLCLFFRRKRFGYGEKTLSLYRIKTYIPRYERIHLPCLLCPLDGRGYK